MRTVTILLGVVVGIGLASVAARAATFTADFNTDPTSILNFGGTLWDGSTTTRTGSANWRNTGGAGPIGGTLKGPVEGVNNDGFLQVTFASANCDGSLSSYVIGGVLFDDFDKGA